MINTKIKPFAATAYKNGEFVEVTEQDVLGKWAVFFFYPADFTFVCPTELGDLADHYEELQNAALKCTQYQQTHTSLTKLGTIAQKQSARSSTTCLATKQATSQTTSV